MMRTTLTIILAPLSLCFSAEGEKVTYADHVRPILEDRCLSCHNPDKEKGGLDMSSYRALMSGGGGGPVASAGDPSGSRIYSTAAHLEEPVMPPEGEKLSAERLAIIEAWVNGGLLETTSSIAAAPKKNTLEMGTVAIGKPEGEPPMPEHLSLEPTTVSPRANAIISMDASPWAPLVALQGERQVILYDTERKDLAGILPFPEGSLYKLNFSQNGSLLLAAGGIPAKSGVVIAWDVKTGQRAIEIGGEYDALLAADISPDHQLIAYGGTGKSVKTYNTTKGEQGYLLSKHSEWITDIAFSPDGKFLASADRNGGVFVWEADNGGELFSLEGHSEAITSLAWRADSQVLATASEDGTLQIWEMTEGNHLKKWTAHNGGVLSVDFSPDGKLVSSGRDNSCYIWDTAGKKLKTIEEQPDIVTQVTFLYDSKHIVTGDWRGTAALWNSEETKRLAELPANPPALVTRLSSVEQELNNLRPKTAELREEADAAEKGIKSLNDSMANLQKAMEESAQRRTTALQRMKEAQAAHDKAQAEKKTQIAQREGIKKELTLADQAKQKLDASRTSHENMKREVAAAQANETQLNTALEAAKKASEAKPEDEALRKTLTSAEQKFNEAKESTKQASTKLAAAAAELAKHEKALPSTPAEDALKRVEDLLARADALIISHRETMNTSMDVANKLEKTEEEKSKELEGMKGQFKVQSKEAAEIVSTATSTTAHLKAVETQTRFWKAQLVNAERSEKQNELDDLKAQRLGIEGGIKQAEEKLKSLKSQIDEIPTLDKFVNEATTKVEATTQSIATAQAAIAPAEKAIKDKSMLRDSHSGKVKGITITLEAAKKRIDELNAEEAGIQKSLDEFAVKNKTASEVAINEQETFNGAVDAFKKAEDAHNAALDSRIKADSDFVAASRGHRTAEDHYYKTPSDPAEAKANAKAEMDRLTAARDAAAKAQTDTKPIVEKTLTDLNAARGNKDATWAKLDAANKSRTAAEGELKKRQAELASLIALPERKAEKEAIQGNLNQSLTAFDAAKKEAEASNTDAEAAIKALETAKKTLADTEASKIAAEKAKTDAIAKRDAAKAALPEAQKQQTSLTEELKQFRAQITELDKKIKSLQVIVGEKMKEYLAMLPKDA